MTIRIEGKAFTLSEIERFLKGERVQVTLSSMKKVKRVRAFVEGALLSDKPYYGINTGVGLLSNKRVPLKDLEKLQENLIISHAVGVGDPFLIPTCKLIMLLRANVLAQGYSGIRVETLKLIVDMLNKNIVPVIPRQGSVGASGDLAPLAHLGLAMIGRGEVFYKEKRIAAKKALGACGLKPVKLAAKEGIALINGTQAMLAMGVFALVKLENLLRASDIVGALSIEGDSASKRPFDKRIHALRPHPGQIATAENIRKLISGSRIIASHKDCKRVQDPYSFRCIPQVHGAAKDAIAYARDVIMREMGSCTDNPLIFADDEEILSGGNFHGEPLAIAMDTMGMAVAELGNIAERRVAILTAPLAGELKEKFLTPESGINSGLMIPHVTMSALVSENKVLAHPACVDSIPTSGGQEDHVSMGTFAARKALIIIRNVEEILAIELFAACEAIDLQRKRGRPGKGTGAVYDLVRKSVSEISGDREFRLDMQQCAELIRSGQVVKTAEHTCGKLKI
ncbi:MAG: histidine ammonia-lyase [Pseudomonadota bacterium]